jgi:hypothetical protein
MLAAHPFDRRIDIHKSPWVIARLQLQGPALAEEGGAMLRAKAVYADSLW